ncbi:MAG: VRR-NUC domain-containing protein [SAR324 cluster bacterium]|nr:VRR-NUC domain-containing protein [SAR324 cluster bacterium]
MAGNAVMKAGATHPAARAATGTPGGRARPGEMLRRTVVQWLEYTKPDGEWFHLPDAGPPAGVEGRAVNAPGVKARVADLVFVLPGGRVGFIELGSGDRPSAARRAFSERVRGLGARYAEAHSIEEVARILRTWGLL